ncbi:Na(+)/H(+) antiporter subunit F [Paracoccus marcusii]|uniref:K+/H+ antiporter subunit F n=1 Tax=Paracoccus marcusii TaxID=59779 RepID=UPI001C3D7E2E|nr:K+/H+ antiporter subunit F [Paracoccus marcusii]QXI64538.1 Na(+)/H(+) antiporter subunit F [Paracoccus marcusii]
MSGTILTFAIGYAQVVLALAGCLAGLRILRGSRAQDRVLALDTLYIAVMLLFLVTGMRLGSLYLFEAAMVIAVMGFVASIALAKFLFRGEVIE